MNMTTENQELKHSPPVPSCYTRPRLLVLHLADIGDIAGDDR
jgi:hypothetical protein